MSWDFWIITFLIGIVILGLIGIIWNWLINRVKDLEQWKEKQNRLKILTVDDHEKICLEQWKRIDNLKEWLNVKFDTINLKIENEILKEIKKLNGKNE